MTLLERLNELYDEEQELIEIADQLYKEFEQKQRDWDEDADDLTPYYDRWKKADARAHRTTLLRKALDKEIEKKKELKIISFMIECGLQEFTTWGTNTAGEFQEKLVLSISDKGTFDITIERRR